MRISLTMLGMTTWLRNRGRLVPADLTPLRLPRRSGLVFGIWFCLSVAGPFPGIAADNAHPVTGLNHPGMEGILHRFFDDRTGVAFGRLRIDRVGVESSRQGFMRVAWRPTVVLEGVTLEIGTEATWPDAGTPILNALHGAGREGCLLRGVRLQVAGAEPREIFSPMGRLRADGALELTDVTMTLGGAAPVSTGTVCFWLKGPEAGRCTTIARPASPANGPPPLSAPSGAPPPSIEK